MALSGELVGDKAGSSRKGGGICGYCSCAYERIICSRGDSGTCGLWLYRLCSVPERIRMGPEPVLFEPDPLSSLMAMDSDSAADGISSQLSANDRDERRVPVAVSGDEGRRKGYHPGFPWSAPAATSVSPWQCITIMALGSSSVDCEHVRGLNCDPPPLALALALPWEPLLRLVASRSLLPLCTCGRALGC